MVLTKPQRLALGTIVLLLVDLIWVSSAELTKYIFKDEDFSKPFFTTYVKTSMFLLYLLGFIFWKPWREQCCQRATNNQGGSGIYSLLEPEDEPGISSEDQSNNESVTINGEAGLSEPVYIPIRFHDGGDRSSGNESDDSNLSKASKLVRFNKLTEVRHLSDLEAEEALFARLSFSATIRARELALNAANKLNIKQVARVAFTFSLLWFVGNLSYQEALLDSEAGLVNVLSSSSGLFTLLLAAIFPSNRSDKFTVSKLLAVIISLVGVGMVSASGDPQKKIGSQPMPPGALWSLVGALCYAAYLVLLRRQVDSEDKMDLPMFFGFVGLFNMLLIWPGLAVLHFARVETLQWPSGRQWMFILVNGLVGTVISELLWLWGCFLTSSLVATLAISLTIPLTIMFDILLKQIDYPHLFFLGSLPMLLSFFAVSLMSHFDNWDPVTDALKKLFRFCSLLIDRCKQPSIRLMETDNEQTESLIGVNSEYT